MCINESDCAEAWCYDMPLVPSNEGKMLRSVRQCLHAIYSHPSTHLALHGQRLVHDVESVLPGLERARQDAPLHSPPTGETALLLTVLVS
jgi:hypothetical protein